MKYLISVIVKCFLLYLGKPPVPDDKVTLTQSQFDRILETIGELTLLAEEKENIGTCILCAVNHITIYKQKS